MASTSNVHWATNIVVNAKHTLQTEVKGNLIPKPASFSFSIDSESKPSSAEYILNRHLKSNYGDDIGFEYSEYNVYQIDHKSGDGWVHVLWATIIWEMYWINLLLMQASAHIQKTHILHICIYIATY